MKNFFFLSFFLGIFLICRSQAEDWKTTDGKTYNGVTIIKYDVLTVTILDNDGGATIPLANLPSNLQKRFNFDPTKAKTAQLMLKAQEKANAEALERESDLISEQQKKRNAEEEKSSDTEEKVQQKAARAEWRKNRLKEIEEQIRDVRLDLGRSNISRTERMDDSDTWIKLTGERARLTQEENLSNSNY